MKGDVMSDYFVILRSQKNSLDTVGCRTFRTFRGGLGVLNKNCGLSPKFYQFFVLPIRERKTFNNFWIARTW